MPETVNITAMAEKLSAQIFSRFGWTFSGPTNENFPCEKLKEHQKESSPTHPVDVVFEYDDPYEPRRKYLLTDLKSYAAGSLNSTRLKGALRDLAKAVDCANLSSEWSRRWTNGASAWDVHGLLFVYNHDKEFDKDFNSLFRDEGVKKLDLPRRCKLFVIGPQKIAYLLSLINDLSVLTSKREFPFFSQIPFLYPDRIRRIAKQSSAEIARIELLMGPWQVVPFDFEPFDDKGQKMPRKAGYKIYYQNTGEVPAEFEFLFDFCFRHQLVKDGLKIEIRMPFAGSQAPHNFAVAKTNFANNFYSSPDIHARLDQFTWSPVHIVTPEFRSEHIGMERRI